MDHERVAFELEGLRKLCIIDTGDGMTGDEMVRFINQLSSSATKQSLQGNYGVGAKIAAATRNPAGIYYFSWKKGVGSMIFLFRDELTQQYGLKQWERSDGTWTHFLPIEDDVKPEIIKDHGTMVVLHGTNAHEDTLIAPDVAPAPRQTGSNALTSTPAIFRFPKTSQSLVVKGTCLSADHLTISEAKERFWAG